MPILNFLVLAFSAIALFVAIFAYVKRLPGEDTFLAGIIAGAAAVLFINRLVWFAGYTVGVLRLMGHL